MNIDIYSSLVTIVLHNRPGFQLNCPEVSGLGGVFLESSMKSILQELYNNEKLCDGDHGVIGASILAMHFSIKNGVVNSDRAQISRQAAEEFRKDPLR